MATINTNTNTATTNEVVAQTNLTPTTSHTNRRFTRANAKETTCKLIKEIRVAEEKAEELLIAEVKAANNLAYPTNPLPPVLRCMSAFSGMGSVEESCKEIFNHKNEWMIEIDKNAQKIFHANHTVKRSYTDITEVDETKLAGGDLFTFGFPCTTFSTMGARKGFADETRGTLVFDAFRIIKELKMKYWIAENVAGLINHDLPYEVDESISLSEEDYNNRDITPASEKKLWNKTVVDSNNTVIYYKRVRKGVEIDGAFYKKGYPSIFNPTEYDGVKKGIGRTLHIIELAALELGYKIKWKVLNAKNFHTAQNRTRIFIVAIREDIDQEFQWPEESPVDTCVFDYMEDDVDYTPDLLNINTNNLIPHVSKNETDIKKIWIDTSVKFEIEKRVHSIEGISPTFLAGGARVKFYDSINECYRVLSVSELKRIQGFNKDFKLLDVVSRTNARKAIGNSISVPVMSAILKNLIPAKYFLENQKKDSVLAGQEESANNVNYNSAGCASTLKLIKEKNSISINRIEKNIGATREIATNRAEKILIENIDKPLTAKSIYINQALIKHSKDQNLFDDLKSMNDKELTKYLKDRKLSILNVDSFSDDSDTKSFVPFPYAGGKQGVNKTSMQKHIRDAFKANRYKAWVDPFAGAFGATYNVLPVLLENGVQEIVINDINKSIINTYRHIQKNPKQVQRHLASISIEYFKEFGKFKPESREEARALHNKLEVEFKELEVQKKMSARRAALFMFLMTKAAGGMVDYDMESKTCDFASSYKIINIDYLINKVEIYHQVFNTIKTTFKSVKYQTIFKKYAKDSDALMLVDCPYIEMSEEVETEKGCSHTYGIDFNHKELLGELKKGEFDYIYYNNQNPLIENYANKHNLQYIKTKREFGNGTTGRTPAIEITMIKITQKEVNINEKVNYISANNISTSNLVA